MCLFCTHSQILSLKLVLYVIAGLMEFSAKISEKPPVLTTKEMAKLLTN
ncbi:hypothetical protein J2772_000167 [Chryseobacterium jejuense]|nr:hypothetical protein [Chryseobacterium jejuense]